MLGTRATLLGAACVLALSGCGAGQEAATANQVTASGGSAGSAGSLMVRNAQFAWSDPVPGGLVYPAGSDAALQVTIVNEKSDGLDDGDRLVAVSSPVAAGGRIVGDAAIPDGQVLTAGYDQPVASIERPGTSSVDIALVGLTTPLRAGLTYPVVFTFENAGEVRLEVGVENPQVLPPRARDGEEEDPSFLETGPDVAPR
ncbi:hypothetical protein GCM10017691_11180 [Pseudonocardia petroleophila]|uniref:Copper(I)-binding protein n=1 Tax=Pseudonocardia petroleophila TaxID=37331 RepID=A0A7G7MIX1_9PSEU|nr:hypothetical protein [Pseudonocardia petroleophila]QNG52732.1 hypothetical protein H6H00_01260 [Pseudonocardia petroleophila]